jgi:hypothetical protein
MARTPIHPGEHLREELETLQMSAAELWRQPGARQRKDSPRVVLLVRRRVNSLPASGAGSRY